MGRSCHSRPSELSQDHWRDLLWWQANAVVRLNQTVTPGLNLMRSAAMVWPRGRWRKEYARRVQVSVSWFKSRLALHSFGPREHSTALSRLGPSSSISAPRSTDMLAAATPNNRKGLWNSWWPRRCSGKGVAAKGLDLRNWVAMLDRIDVCPLAWMGVTDLEQQGHCGLERRQRVLLVVAKLEISGV